MSGPYFLSVGSLIHLGMDDLVFSVLCSYNLKSLATNLLLDRWIRTIKVLKCQINQYITFLNMNINIHRIVTN